jgi:hypothetical protein
MLAAAVVTAVFALGAAGPTSRAQAGDCAQPPPSAPIVERPRYAAPERIHQGASVVVHYVEEGNDAPPLDTVDGDRIPDYVEAAAEAGDRAVSYYGVSHIEEGLITPGFFVALCDSGGIDARPDIYIAAIEGFGIARPPTHAEGGPFVVISPRLAVTGGIQNFQGDGVRFTVLHEFFHLVQYAYVPQGMPRWVAEGTANAMAMRAERVSHPIIAAQVDTWVRVPHLSLYDVGEEEERSYSGVHWWFADLTVVPAYFERLAELARAGREIGRGLEALRTLYADQHPSLGAAAPFALDIVWWAHAVSVYLVFNASTSIQPIKPLYTLNVSRSGRHRRTLNGMAIHYVRLAIPRGVRSLTFTASAPRRHPEVIGLLGVRGDTAREINGPLTVRRFFGPRTISFRILNERERRNSILVISNADEQPVNYTLRYSVRRAAGSGS